MPWHIVKDHAECGPGKWAVVKNDDGDVEGCHPSEEAAKRQMAALYANEENSAPLTGETRWAERQVPFRAVQSGDGLTLEGYAAVFNSPARIDSWEGRFDEVIAPGAFTRSLAARTPVLMFNHGKHPLIGDMPLGVIREATEDAKGLHIVARLTDNWLIQPVRDAVRDDAITGMSFRFSVPDGGDTWQRRSDDVDLRTVTDLDTPELGPVVFPAYEPTTVSVRSLIDRLPDLTGRSDARSTDGGDPDSQPSSGDLSTPTQQARTRDRVLRMAGVIK